MSKHTPGPWTIGEVSYKKQRVDIDSLCSDPKLGHQEWHGLARAYGSKEMPEEGSATMLANARLIAAAPELLAALTRLEFAAQCRDNTLGDPCRLLEVKAELAEAAAQARAAIAKAGGES